MIINKKMKKEAILLFVIIILIGLFSVIKANDDKIQEKIYQELEKSNETSVIIFLNEPKNTSGLIIKRELTKLEIENEKSKNIEEVIENIGKDGVKDVLKNYNLVYAKIDKNDLNKLEKNDNIKEVRKEVLVSLFMQDALTITNASKTWASQSAGINITGKGESVCLIDTGTNKSHPDLNNKVIAEYCYCRLNGGCCNGSTSESSSAEDDNGHGTHVAGIIAANGTLKGMAPGANIVSIKILNATGSGHELDLIGAIDWCVSNASKFNISVITLSLGTGTLYSSYCDSSYSNWASSINNAIANNISVLSASGNSGSTSGIASPACIENATAIGAVGKSDSLNYNRNWMIKLLGIGVNINSTCITGDYCVKSGTSMATPMAAGAFALVRQFTKLSGRTYIPSEIKAVLNNTGKLISENGINYSRIDVYNAIMSLATPSIINSYPENNTKSKQAYQNFTCNSSIASISSLANVTFILSNATSLVYNETKNITGIENNTLFNYTFSQENSYFWGCSASSNSSYSASSGNFTFAYDITPPSISINNPRNNSWQNSANFNISLNEAGNCWFSLNNSENVSMSKDSAGLSFNYSSLLNQELYNASFYCNDTAGNLNSSSLIFFNVDLSKPNVTSISPASGYSETASLSSIVFKYNASDNLNITKCELILNNISVASNSSAINTTESNITYILSSGIYSWQINCTDEAGNIGNSSSRTLTISSPVVAAANSPGGGGSSGGSSTGIIYSVSFEQISSGVNKEIEKEDKIKFELNVNGNNEKHLIKIQSLSLNSATLTINSTPMTLTLGIGEEKKINLDSDNYYDLYLKLNSIINSSKANLTIKAIYEKIIVQSAPAVNNTIKNESANVQPIIEKKENPTLLFLNKTWTYLVGFIMFIMIVIIVIMIIRMRRIEYKVKFRRKG
jgi:subtilisin family serine protease